MSQYPCTASFLEVQSKWLNDERRKDKRRTAHAIMSIRNRRTAAAWLMFAGVLRWGVCESYKRACLSVTEVMGRAAGLHGPKCWLIVSAHSEGANEPDDVALHTSVGR